MFWFVIFLFVIALVCWLLARRLRQQSGLPGGRIVYSDTRLWGQPVQQPLYDGSIGLVGKPDYLVKQGNLWIPVEVKSCQPPPAPYDSHIFQLAAYCLLVEKVYQSRPPHGLIHYPGRTFQVDFTEALRQETLALVREMHAQERKSSLPRSHDQTSRCAGCGYKSHCDQRL
jgi:CRISPR-associated exonuclease Cas4